ncbi:MAG: acyl-CoA dehydrogenase family protein [Dehalococcoidales bacterium]|nr:acyl-CoA dehydrogenase family protein [Dehalococcoidales bacterium]
MEFELSEELKMIQSLTRDFVNEQLKPLERDILGRAADLSDSRTYLPSEIEEKLIKMAIDMGLWGASIPEEFGGGDLGVLANCLIEEELAQTVIPFNLGNVTPILFDCNTEQRKKYLLPVINRQKQAYLALMEPGGNTELSSMKMKFVKKNDCYVLNGKKISFSRTSEDYFAIVFAAAEEGGGVSCLLVDKNTPGFTVTGGQEKTGWQSQIKEPLLLNFENCHLTAENVLGDKGKAFSLGKKWLPVRRIIRAARCIGVARRLLEESTIRAESWESFGQVISQRVSVEAALADIAMFIHAGQLMTYEAAWKADNGEIKPSETALLKLFSNQVLRSVSDQVAHIYNGPPYIAGLPIEQLCRQALATSSTDFALELQRNIIVKDILKGVKI